MDPNRRITKKFTKKFGSKASNRQYFHRKTGLHIASSESSWNNNLMCSINIWKVEKFYKDSLDSIPSPSPTVKIQIIGWKVYFD